MSGTSMDGIDGVLTRFEPGQPPVTEASTYFPYPPQFIDQLSTLLRPGDNELERAAQLGTTHSYYAAELVASLIADFTPNQITAIGNHGQTVRHAPLANPAYTLQIGNGAVLAEQTGITTVTDFRSRDIAAGGEGAPLVPAFHHAVFSQAGQHRIIVNIGGISNISSLPGDDPAGVTGFDCGPGNTLLDNWASSHIGQAYDHNGEWGRSGTIDDKLLNRLLSEPYFKRIPPKSTGRELFNRDWLQRYLSPQPSNAADVQASLTALTARAITDAIDQYAATRPDRIYLCGGGAKNQFLTDLITAYGPCPVTTTAELGIDPQTVEAVAFAWLAQQTLSHLPGNLPAVTGARRSVVLGCVHPA